MIVRTPQYVLDKIERAVWDGIQEGYRGEDVFGPVVVVEHPDVFGEDVIHIYVLYEGKDKTLDYDFQADVVENIRCNVTLDEMPFAPSVQFCHKSSRETALDMGGQVDTQELISLARELTARAGGNGQREPRQTDLRRAVSSAYYAMFHALCAICADMLAGATWASASPTFWSLAYSALEHGYARNRFRDYSVMSYFPRAIRRFGDLLVELQCLRQKADYDPTASFDQNTVSEHIERASRAIADLTRAPRADLRALALYVLLRPRRE